MDLTAVVVGHHEGLLAHRTLLAAWSACEYAREHGATVELLAVLDRPDAATLAVFHNFARAVGRGFRTVVVDNGDLGLTRNSATVEAQGDYIAFCDGDDIWSENWLWEFYSAAFRGPANAIYHPQLNYFFGDVEYQFLREHLSTDDVRFDPDEITQFNSWSALCAASRETLLQYPYRPVGGGFGFEDWMFNLDTLADGCPHFRVANTMHFIRVKPAGQSLCKDAVARRLTHGPSKYYDRRPERTGTVEYPEIDRQWFRDEVLRANQVEPLIWMPEKDFIFYSYPKAARAETTWAALEAWGEPGGDAIFVPGPGIGGAENMARKLCATLKANGRRVIVVFTDYADGEPFVGADSVVDLSARAKLYPADIVEIVLKLCVQRRPTAIHAINNSYVMTMANLNITAMTQGCPMFFWNFGLHRYGNGRIVSTAFWNPEIVPQLAGVITDSKYWVRELQRRYGYSSQKFHVVPTPVPPAAVERQPGEGLRVLWAGRLESEKGIDLLIETAMKTLQAGLPITYHVYGTGSLQEHVEQAAKLLKNLEFCGNFSRFSDIPAEKYDAYLLTSKTEGKPQTLLEAMATGLVPVMTPVGGVPEVYRDSRCGYMAEAVTSDAVFQALLQACLSKQNNWDDPPLAVEYIRSQHSQQAFEAVLTAAGALPSQK